MRDPTRQSRGLIRVAAQLALRAHSGQRLREKLTTCLGSEAGLTFHLPVIWKERSSQFLVRTLLAAREVVPCTVEFPGGGR